ncbi:MAG TPA: 2,3-epoxybenzoyl-CoA dihydrolase [Vicinamibacterales bacterium]|nr:2,3-epoxybenzoyl-CoA dihydrolase [Vicinamibacterales bacterium]
MDRTIATDQLSITFETAPDRYKHWNLSIDGSVATLAMDVKEDAGLRPQDYKLKLNSYDLGVDIELADALQRIRFEHPEVHAVVVASLKPRIFCAGANIFMLGTSSHGFKVNFCKFTNETRLGIEDMSVQSGVKFLAALNGICAGGGYELALACDEIHLVDDGSASVALPETPLLGVLPGTGGLTRVVDKRKVRRDLADVFGTLVEGVRGRRAVEWRLVDKAWPASQFKDGVARRAAELAKLSDRPSSGPGIALAPLAPAVDGDSIRYRYLQGTIDRTKRTCELTIIAPDTPQPLTAEEFLAAGDQSWALRAFRELDDALLRLRFNEPEIGMVALKAVGDATAVLDVDRALDANRNHWLVREIISQIRRTLKRLDLTSRSFFALVEPGNAFAGTLFDLALACDRIYMLNNPDESNTIQLSAMNAGAYPMSTGLSRLETRFLGEPQRVREVLNHDGPFDAQEALDAGLVSFAPDDMDWDDEVRLAIEARTAFSPDALTGMEANLRFAGPETMETKIFGRLTAWQNWIFQRPNAVGERGALTVYGREGRPQFDWKRT